jgi:hypothetical protein
VSTEYGELVTEHEDLDVFGWAGSGEQRQPAQHPGEQQTEESEDHSERACSAGCRPWPRSRLAAKELVRRPDTVLGTHTIRG